MVKRIRLTAICVLLIYCFLFLLANSPLHIYLFHRSVNSQTYDYSPTRFSSFVKSKSEQECPLCKFLSLTLFPGMVGIFIILMAFRHFISLDRYKNLYLPKIKYYDALAPPVVIPQKFHLRFCHICFNHSYLFFR